MAVDTRAVGGALASAALLISLPFIAQWEGKRNDPYRDIVGVQTVCYGETNVPMRRYTDAECTEMLSRSVAGYRDQVLRCTPVLAGHPVQLAAATSLAYNIGPAAYCRSTVDRRFDAGDFPGACEAFKRWNMAGGRVVPGLVNRRNQEYELCMTYLPVQ